MRPRPALPGARCRLLPLWRCRCTTPRFAPRRLQASPLLRAGFAFHRSTQIRIKTPPVQPDLLCLVDRTDKQADPNRQQFNVRQRDANVTRDDQTFVQHPVQYVEQIGGTRNRGYTIHRQKSANERNCSFRMRELTALFGGVNRTL